MRKRIVGLLLILCLLAGGAAAEGVRLRTTSIFAGKDFGAQTYIEILAAYEAETGNIVEDESSASDEVWKSRVLNDFAAGNEPDILFFFACTADSKPLLRKVVPIHEINEAYPDLQLEENEKLREADGNVYAISVRPFWEGLLVNVDLFEAYDLPLPTDWEKFEHAIAVFSQNGIVPLAASLSDIPHYLAEITILACGSVEDHRARPTAVSDMPDSWLRGMELLRHLYSIGAFASNVNTTSHDMATALFSSKKAAMQVDGSWLANSIPQDNWDSTIVLPFPVYHEEADPEAILGGTSMGFYMTRRAWTDPAKRDAALDLFTRLTGEKAAEGLGFAFSGRLYASSQAMYNTAMMRDAITEPMQDSMDPDVRAWWFSQISGIAEGTIEPMQALTELIERGAFE